VRNHLEDGTLGLELDGAALEIAGRARHQRVQVGRVHAAARCLAAFACPHPTPTRIIAAAASSPACVGGLSVGLGLSEHVDWSVVVVVVVGGGVREKECGYAWKCGYSD
jgi:hypothetical protein